MSEIFVIEEIAVGLLLIATFVGILARRLRMPYTVGLVLVGAALAILNQELHIELDSEIILGIFVPPLIFEAAFHLPIPDLRRNIVAILILAIAGVLLTTLLVGGIVSYGTGMPIGYAIIFGSIIAATDPIAVIALFKSLGVPKRLQVLLEGESLLNDGTAIVIFNIAIVAAITGHFNLVEGFNDFIVSAGFGLGVGFVLGILASIMIARIDDHLIETAITFVLAYGAFIVAESLHVSGVLAVVAAGLANGNIGPRGMSPTTRIVVFNFWEFMSFITNSFVFLLIGLITDISLIVNNWQAIVWGIFAALVSRLLVIYGLLQPFKNISMRWKHVIYWGGLRGAISLALVISLSSKLDSEISKQLMAMVFGLVLFTLLIQGTSMNWVIKKLKIITRREDRTEYDISRARAVSTRASYEHLEKIYKSGMISKHVWEILIGVLDPYTKNLTTEVRAILKKHPEVKAEELDTAWREFLSFQRNQITELLTNNIINNDVYSDLVNQIDYALDLREIKWDDVRHLNELFLTAHIENEQQIPDA
ncbi:MAG: Na+/H+ antiporter [Anaerolineales bacterium]|nr:Na+/H+ antiporter [Anaerolineales bacterium]